MTVEEFLAAARFVLHVEPDENRPYSSVVAFDFQSDSLTLVATDGVRMAVAEMATSAEPKVYCVPREAFEDAIRGLDEAVGDLCFYPAGRDRLGAISENCVSLEIPLSGVGFPDWSRCTRPELTGAPELWVPAHQWAEAFTALADYQGGESDAVRVGVSGKYQAVKISSADGKAYAMVMPCLPVTGAA